MHLNANKTGLALGGLLGAWHIVWAILVATGIGQALYDFILWAHMIHLSVVIGPFDAVAAGVVIVVAAIIGYVFGYAFALIWNRVHRAP